MPPEEPGPYIEETAAGARPIEAVATSIAALIGYAEKGPLDEPVQVRSLSDFQREFGSISADSDLSLAVAQFFMSGGSTAWIVRVVGSTVESEPTSDELIGAQTAGTGIYALDSVDLFNLLLIPGAADISVHNAMITYAERRCAFAILDLPASVLTVAQAQSWIAAAPKAANAAAYFPRLLFADPANPGKRRAFANSGAVAGAFARTDAQRGVWKAPAGIDAYILGTLGVETRLTDADNGLLNPLGLNALRQFPSGTVVWGGRTLMGGDSLASEWKYVPVRRTALMIEESLSRGLKWVVFEPNNEQLWAQIRRGAGAFMQSLFRQGAFQGTSPRDAYFVKCDCDTTTTADLALGVANLIIGFAPLKPAEFVVLKISLLTQAE